MHPIYLDHAATTPVAEPVLAAMLPYFSETFGNPSAIHRWGQRAWQALQQARKQVAALLHCAPGELIFTGSGSEGANLAIRGIAIAAQQAGKGNHIVLGPLERQAVSQTIAQLQRVHGFDVTVLPVDSTGLVAPADFAAALRPDTVLASVAYANNEVGTIQPLAELGRIARAHAVPLHTDAVQAASQLALDVQTLNVDALSLAAHKFYGPKGVGALYLRQGVTLLPQQMGGSQEQNRRAGTENVPLIVGLAAALQLAVERRAADVAHYTLLRDRLIAGILAACPDCQLTGHPQQRLPNHASFACRNISGNELLLRLDVAGIAASSGSACSVGNPSPSKVLQAMGLRAPWDSGGLRLTVGRANTPPEIDQTIRVLQHICQPD